MPTPPSNQDFDFFYAGIADGRFLVQKCAQCGEIRNPPGPMCARCQSLDWIAQDVSGEGTIYSYTTHYYPPLSDFTCPHTVAVVDMDEGFRQVGAVVDVDPGSVLIGQRVRVSFRTARDGTPTYAFVACVRHAEVGCTP